MRRARPREQAACACPCEWEAAGLVPPSMTPEDLEMAVYDALMEFGDPNGSRDAGDVEAPMLEPLLAAPPTST